MPPSLGFFDVMGAPLLVVLLFAAVLSYLGVHIIRRQVIFVDLALGQTAALGATVGFLFGLTPASPGAYLFSLIFALVAAALFAITRPRRRELPHEAVIGLIFAVAAAAEYIVVDRSAHGAEHVHTILTGAILWTTWAEVASAAAMMTVAGGALAALHKKLVALSAPHAQGDAPGHAPLWDFVFYATFGLVISVTVRTAGVLPTFAMLVGPAILGSLVAQSFHRQVLLSWLFSSVAGIVALCCAYGGDWPGGPTLVMVNGLTLLVGAVAYRVWRADARGAAVGRVVLGGLAAVLLIAAVLGIGKALSTQAWANPAVATHAGEVAP